MRTDSISPLATLDAFETITAIIIQIGDEMIQDSTPTSRQPLSQVHDRSSLILAGPAAELPPHCGICKSFRAHTSECRRYAPYLRGLAGDLKTKWPDVSPADVCGEFESL
jgi:hypothetical protein